MRKEEDEEKGYDGEVEPWTYCSYNPLGTANVSHTKSK